MYINIRIFIYSFVLFVCIRIKSDDAIWNEYICGIMKEWSGSEIHTQTLIYTHRHCGMAGKNSIYIYVFILFNKSYNRLPWWFCHNVCSLLCRTVVILFISVGCFKTGILLPFGTTHKLTPSQSAAAADFSIFVFLLHRLRLLLLLSFIIIISIKDTHTFISLKENKKQKILVFWMILTNNLHSCSVLISSY